MANNPLSLSEVQSLITLAHVLQARDALLNNGEKKGNLVYFKENNIRGHYLAVFKGDNDNEYKPKELVRIACLAYQNINLKSKSQIDKNYDNLKYFSGGKESNFFLNGLRSSEKEYIIYNEKTGDERAREIVGEDNLVFDQKTRKIVSKDGTVAGLKATNEQGANEMDKYVKPLKQFKQVIFYGPPGTGKTYQAKATLKNMLGMENDSEFAESQGKRWDIVQFHPSYNYEDFVRGVQVSTNDEEQVKYETKNRIFGSMCQKALDNTSDDYALIIDEINRANVSSVLGELIYALEYRDKSVSTPYEVDGSRLLTIPPNLYIIGTMNTADRTIGALDYAVRRRFAFVHCPPDESLIEDAKAKSVFSKVKHIFAEFLSPDFDAADVEIGHSYFMAEGEELRGKIQYQVIPILEEYVKDGVLLPEAKDKIKKLLQEEQEQEPLQPPPPIPPGQFLWTRDGRSGTNGVGRTVFSIVQDYVDNDEPQDIEELQEAFPGTLARQTYTVISYADRDTLGGSYYPETIPLQDGSLALCCNQWGATGYAQSTWDRFKTRAEALGYTITGVE